MYRCQWSPEGIRFLEVGVAGGCESHNLGARN